MLLNVHFLHLLEPSTFEVHVTNMSFWNCNCIIPVDITPYCYPPGNKAQGETSTGYSTFKPTRLVAASEVVANSEPAKVEESTGKGSGSDSLKSEPVKPENAGKESGSDALRSEPVKAEENVGKGSGSDQETPPQGTQL